MNIINTDYIKKGENVFLFMVDIYPRGLWTLHFQKATVSEFRVVPEVPELVYPNLEYEDKYSFMLSVRRYVDEKYAAYLNGYNFSMPMWTLDNNTIQFLKTRRKSLAVSNVERHYYICSSFKGALEALKKYHITNRKYNEITTRKRQRIYKEFVTSWLKTNHQINFVFSIR